MTTRQRGRDLLDPWIEGYEARQARQARSANPYRGADTRQLWDSGWLEAHGQCGNAGGILATDEKADSHR